MSSQIICSANAQKPNVLSTFERGVNPVRSKAIHRLEPPISLDVTDYQNVWAHRTMATTPKIRGISPDEALEVCARQIIVTYFQQMMSYKAGAKVGSDIEFVHQMRVTSRRLRTAMDNFADCFPEKPFKKHYKTVKSITRTLGAIRDLDVLIARFEKELETLPEVERADIRGLITHLQREREAARKPMLMLFAELESTGFERKFLAFFKGV